ncbi:internal scaffolding protein [Blackfly microvirus SF02]|uniref:Internal scaffolding protein n=1 Tax=Blackfly microvirus SF02 TaxID=2576452 RepID=A0A4V1F5D4_9VIRU|nr:internal scaffolding protein [Blackfly microvirus SF02]
MDTQVKQKFQMPDGEIVEKDFPIFKTNYNHDTNFESDRTATYCKDPSLTKQEFVEDADINNILERFARTKETPPLALPEHFADVTKKQTYLQMQEQLVQANRMFYTLEPGLRAEYQNDPNRWADAVAKAALTGDGDALEGLGIDTSAERAEALKRAQEAADASSKAAREAANKTEPGK